METIAEWDSLTFMSVFSAVNDAFGIDPDFDDANHYLSIPALHRYSEAPPINSLAPDLSR